LLFHKRLAGVIAANPDRAYRLHSSVLFRLGLAGIIAASLVRATQAL